MNNLYFDEVQLVALFAHLDPDRIGGIPWSLFCSCLCARVRLRKMVGAEWMPPLWLRQVKPTPGEKGEVWWQSRVESTLVEQGGEGMEDQMKDHRVWSVLRRS